MKNRWCSRIGSIQSRMASHGSDSPASPGRSDSAAHPFASGLQVLVYSWAAIGLPTLLEHHFDLLTQFAIDDAIEHSRGDDTKRRTHRLSPIHTTHHSDLGIGFGSLP